MDGIATQAGMTRAAGGGGGISVLATVAAVSASPGSSCSATTAAIDTSGASILVVAVTTQGLSGTVSDSEGNTWTALTQSAGGSTAISRLYYCLSPSTSASHTFTVSSLAYPVIYALAASGVTTYEEEDVVGGTAASSTSGCSVAGTYAESLVVSAIQIWTSNTGAMDSGFTTIQTDFSSGINYGAAFAYKVTATPISPTWSWASSDEYAAAMASFT
jgi:hypothetical protein